ncbi:glycerophosphodiester phosphodiesterase family protein [Spirillospora sp. NPDC029432]|uniref:glycerophosphodiester phosphodiesterase n=1 Tax=Spirillospora sp. NPDC029432 TaxID=3154599 RepID=UPI0034563901
MLRRFGLSLAAVVAATAITGTAADASARSADIVNVAHRGASADAPENTVAAFKLARRQGADQFEVDVQETKDHKLVAIHDTTLARTTNVESVYPRRKPWKVGSFTLAEIRKLDAGSWFGKRYKGERVPTLRETLRAMRSSGMGIQLEIKSPRLYPGIERRVAAELRANPAWTKRRLVVQSFDFASMRRFHKIMPAAPTGLIGTPAKRDLPKLAKYADQINPPYGDVTESYVKSVHRQKMEVFTWTVDDRSKMRRAIALGVDGIITNRPGRLDDVILKSRLDEDFD